MAKDFERDEHRGFGQDGFRLYVKGTKTEKQLHIHGLSQFMPIVDFVAIRAGLRCPPPDVTWMQHDR